MEPRQRMKGFGLLRLLAVLAVFFTIAAACGGGNGDETAGTEDTGLDAPEQTDEGEPQPGGTVVMGLEAETNNWLPGKYAGANAGENVRQALFDSLMQRGEDGKVRPYLAESVESNEDATEWTVKLREGVTFHDGTALDAAVLKWNFDTLLLAPDSNARGSLTTFKVNELRIVDPLTVTYVLGEGNAAFPDLLTGTIGMPFSKAAFEKFGEDAGSNPVGTGPFKFVSWQRDSKLIVEKNANYWQKGLPYLDRIEFRPIPDEDTRFQSLLSGDIDAMHSLRQSIVAQAIDAANGGTVEVDQYIGNNGGGSIFNTKKAPVDDARVRRGLAYALDQEALVEVLGGVEVAGLRTQYYNDKSIWHSEKAEELWPNNNPEKAQELLNEYINDPKRSDGKPVGTPISVEFNCPPDQSLLELAQLYQSFWSSVGVQVKLNQVEQAAHIQNGLTDNYMINCWRMGADSDPYTVLSSAFAPLENPLNFTNYRNDLIVKNLEILRTSTDQAERKAAVEEIMVHFTDAVPNLWTGGTPTIVAFKPEVNGVSNWKYPNGDPGGGQLSAVVNWAHVWRAS